MVRKYKLIAFDLDDTLIDTTGQLVEPALKKTWAVFQQYGMNLDWATYLADHKEFMKTSPREDFFSEFANEQSLSKSAAEEAKNLFYTCEIDHPISLMRGALEVLTQLKENYSIHLVTMGDEEKQKKKIHLLKIEMFFTKLWVVDYRLHSNKESAFKQILQSEGIAPQELLSVGNRLDHEIADGNRLGCATCLIEHGEHFMQKNQSSYEVPDFRIKRIDQLIETCQL